MNTTRGKTTHFVGLTKPKQTYQQKPNWVRPTDKQILAIEEHVTS